MLEKRLRGKVMKNNVQPQSKNQIFNNSIVEDKKLMTKKELAEFLNVSVKLIDKKVHLKQIPFEKIDRLVRFKKSKILAWLEEINSSRSL